MASLVTARARAVIQHLATGVQIRKSLRSSAEPPTQRSNTAAALKTTEAAASTWSSISIRLARSRGRAISGPPKAARPLAWTMDSRSARLMIPAARLPLEAPGARGGAVVLRGPPPPDPRGAPRVGARGEFAQRDARRGNHEAGAPRIH